MGQQVVVGARESCSSGIPSCKYEARCSVSQMHDALREAKKYDVRGSPYGVPTYPYVWEGEPTLDGFMGPTVRLHMEPPFTAVFGFERQRIGVLIHVAVFDLSKEGRNGICKDIQVHIDAVRHLRGTLFGMTQTYVVEAPR